MVGMPSKCPNCGNIFASGMIEIDNSCFDLSGSNVKVTCPRCGHFAEPISGLFAYGPDDITVIKASPENAALIEIIQRALRDAKSGVDPDRIVYDLKKVSPELAAKAARAVRLGGGPALLTMLFWILYTCANNPSSKMDWNVLFDQAVVYSTNRPEYQFPAAQTVEPVNKPGPPPAMNRQQRRQQERQSRKQPPQPSQPRSKKPK